MALNTIETLDPQPFHRSIVTVGNLPSAFTESMSYYEMLAWVCQYIQDYLIPAVNGHTNLFNELLAEFDSLRQEVLENIRDIPQLRADFEALSNKLDAELLRIESEIEAERADITKEIDRKIAQARTDLTVVMNGIKRELNERIDEEVEDLNYKIDHIKVGNLTVFNSIRGYNTSLQEFLDDIADSNRLEAITAGEYDSLNLGALEYDSKQITAYNYDYYGKTILIPA